MGDPIDDGREEVLPEPRRLRQLRWMVNALTLTLLAGFLTVVATIVIRLSAAPPAPPVLPEALSLPRGERARAVTLGTGWVAVVTVDATGLEHVRVFDAETGAERAAIAIEPRE